MGLRVVAYSHLEPVGLHTEFWCDDEEHVMAFAYATFPRSFRGIRVLGKYRDRERDTFLQGGCFAVTPSTKIHTFDAGSYKSYGRWRDHLSGQFNPGPRPRTDKPFYELIWFADNEGCIGQQAAADLLADFRHHASLYRPPADDVFGRYTETYGQFTRACELAAESGLISFR